jgi:hypothetical protein
MDEGDTEGAFALTEETKVLPTAQAHLNSLLEGDLSGQSFIDIANPKPRV